MNFTLLAITLLASQAYGQISLSGKTSVSQVCKPGPGIKCPVPVVDARPIVSSSRKQQTIAKAGGGLDPVSSDDTFDDSSFISHVNKNPVVLSNGEEYKSVLVPESMALKHKRVSCGAHGQVVIFTPNLRKGVVVTKSCPPKMSTTSCCNDCGFSLQKRGVIMNGNGW
jgi:hypothetical protein